LSLITAPFFFFLIREGDFFSVAVMKCVCCRISFVLVTDDCPPLYGPEGGGPEVFIVSVPRPISTKIIYVQIQNSRKRVITL